MRNKKLWQITGLVSLLFTLSGCALFLLSAGAAGGLAISKDTIEGVVERPFDRVYAAGRDVLKEEGFIKLENRSAGIVEAEVRKSQVKFELQQISESTVRFRVKARRSHKLMPDMDLANELYNKIFTKIR